MIKVQLVLDLLRIILSWPVVLFVLVLYFLKTFRQPLIALLSSRNVKMQAYGVSLEVAGEQQKASVTETHIARPENVIESYIRNNPKEVVMEFQRAYNAYFFERTLNAIFGSQLRLLKHLLVKGDEGDSYAALHSFYAEYWDSTNLEFAHYLGFLKQFNFIRYEGDPMRVCITPYGTDFRSYIKSQYAESFLSAKPY